MNVMYTIGGVIIGISTVMQVNLPNSPWGIGLIGGVVLVFVAALMEYNR
jgi:hypothetical protein